MPNGLIKFMNRRSDDMGRKLHWGRADIDGAPFIGEPPLASEEELESRLVRVCDPRNRQFDLSRPDENKAYLEVLDRCFNGLASLIYRKRTTIVNKKKKRFHVIVYVEWVEMHMEDGQPLLAQRPYVGRPND